VTLTQLSAFVLTARLGSVKEAAKTLNVSEPAVSQAITALRQHLGDPLITRDASGMKLTAAGARLLPIASQMVALGAEAQAAVRVAQGLPEQLRLVTSSVVAEFIAAPLTEAFAGRAGRSVEASAGVAVSTEMPVLVANRLADIALGPNLARPGLGLNSEPVFKYKMVAVTSPRVVLRGAAASWQWLVDPSGADPGSDVSALLRSLAVPESRISVFPNLTAAWDAAAGGDGVAPAVAHLVAHQVRRGELKAADGVAAMDAAWYATTLPRDRRPGVAGSLRHFLGTPEAMQLMREPRGGVPVSRFRPPVYVTIWS
jgi:LysR family transcriptional regulator, low CO2-responsive transcriptional regulator